MLIDNKEYIPGVCCLAAQVRNYTNEACSALSIAIPFVRLKDNNIPLMIKNIIAIAHEISDQRKKWIDINIKKSSHDKLKGHWLKWLKIN